MSLVVSIQVVNVEKSKARKKFYPFYDFHHYTLWYRSIGIESVLLTLSLFSS